MSVMGIYCKAYPLKDFRQYANWTENLANARPEAPLSDEQTSDAKTVDAELPRTLSDESVLFLHTNFVVTDGVYQDEHIIFADVDESWQQFCEQQLGFIIPDDVLEMQKISEQPITA